MAGGTQDSWARARKKCVVAAGVVWSHRAGGNGDLIVLRGMKFRRTFPEANASVEQLASESKFNHAMIDGEADKIIETAYTFADY